MNATRVAPVGGRRREGGTSIAPYILILPSLLLAFWIIGYPIWDLTDMSLHSVTRFGQLKDYSGLANFSKLIAEPLFFEFLIRTLIWTFAVVGGTVLLSIPIALILADDFIGRHILRVIIMLPWAVSLTMSGIVWRWALNGQSGMVNATLYDFGAIREPVAWLATAGTAFPIEIAIGILSDGISRRSILAPSRNFRGRSHRWRQRLAALEVSHSAAAPPIHQHRSRPQFHLRLQFLSAHLGDDSGRSRQQHRHTSHLALQAGFPVR